MKRVFANYITLIIFAFRAVSRTTGCLTLALYCGSLLTALLIAQPTFAGTWTHHFDCQECHNATVTMSTLGGGNVCLRCHGVGGSSVTINPGVDVPYPRPAEDKDGLLDTDLSANDASDRFGRAPGATVQSSHNWAVPSDILAAAGAQAPVRSEFYSNFGTSHDKVTCSRCHNPHADYFYNPKLLRLAPEGATPEELAADSILKADAMCLACHIPWATDYGNGLLTHPVGINYAASVTDHPDKYATDLSNTANADIRLIDGTVSCTSCHGVHFTDSDASTIDGVDSPDTLSASQGALLRGDGAERADQSSLCQSCHTYEEHGDNSGEKAGCLVCHSGHSYDAADPEHPNYFVLRKQATTASFGTVTNLAYSDPGVLDPLNKYTFWQDQSDGTDNGYCERCHGDAAALPGSIHTSAAVCTDCHKHNPGGSGSFGHGDGGDCKTCHTAVHNVDSTQAKWITFFDNGADHTWDAGYTIDTYATCSMCHANNLLPIHSDNCALCHFGSSPPRDSFTNWNQTCQQGSCHASYHPNASPGHDSEYNLNLCNTCHNATGREGWYDDYAWDWIARADFCGECHTFPADTNPPVSETDLQPNYIDDAVITLSAFDPWGVQFIYYRLDGGATQTYSGPITVVAPASGSQGHTLEYWALDNSNKEETPNSQGFTIAKDTTPPVTTSDAKPLYGTDATIQLTATDDATSFPVAATYYKDGVDGTVQSGTIAIVPEPASGSEEHTLYFWSVDHAGNIEDPPKSATFTIVANGLVQTAMPMGNWLYGYSDPYAPADRVLADPWMSYAIYVDDVLIDSFTKKFYISIVLGQPYPPMPQTWSTTWRCPPGIPVASGSHIDIVVNAGFSDRALWAGVNDVPATYTLSLPEGTAQLESVDWTFTTSLNWKDWDYNDDWEEDISWVGVLPAVENISYITTVLDTTPPTTTSNVVSGKAYLGATTFALTAADPSGTGVESTWWQLDSTSGTWTQGTSVPVAAPATGTTKSHTLYWYSKDYAGNQETVKSVSFSIDAIQTVTATLTRSPGVSAYADDGPLDTAWASYTIKLDGVTIGSRAANASTSWLCPQRDITGAGIVEIVVNAGFTDRPNWEPDSEVPATFTLALPAGAQRLENVYWTGFTNKSVGIDYDDACPCDYAYATIPAGTFGNIRYIRTGTDADTTAPATTCSATEGATYNGDQAFTLTPTDAGTGVESTWWQLDGSGIWNIGTSVPVAAPASGTVSHTIIWFSRDNAANQETQQSVTFNMQP